MQTYVIKKYMVTLKMKVVCLFWVRNFTKKKLAFTDNCGVIHIHENVKVVGGSRAEDHMTRCAIADVFEHGQNSQELAVQCEPMSEVKSIVKVW